MRKKVFILGAGFSGMATAAILAKNGFEVEIFEKNDAPGGKARHFTTENFTFDMGPVWFAFPELLKEFFSDFQKQAISLPEFHTLSPSFRVFIKDSDYFDINPGRQALEELFSKNDKQGIKKLKKYLQKAESEYSRFTHLFKNEDSLNTLMEGAFSGFLHSHSRYIRSLFQDEKLLAALEFPVCSPGVLPLNHKVLSFAKNYSIFTEGLQYPEGGIKSLIDSMVTLLDKLDVSIHLSSEVENYDIIGDKVSGIITRGKNFHADYFITTTDYHHAEHLLPAEKRNYPESIWDKFNNTPSVLIFYLGINKKLKNLVPNTMYFYYSPRSNQAKKALKGEIFESPAVFINSPSKIGSQHPKGHDSLVIRTIIPSGFEDIGKVREHYYEQAIDVLERVCSENIRDHIVYKRTYAQTDFESDYHTFQGKAFGFLAQTQGQLRKPLKTQNQHLSNLFYTEQTALPGIGIISALLSGKIMARQLMEYESHSKK